MLKILLIAGATSVASAAAAQPAVPADQATQFVTTIIDKFNGGDTRGWLSAQESNTQIVDEFAPYAWTGAGSPQRWLDGYAKYAQANGVSGGRVDYGKPLQATSDGKSAYVVLPTTYRFVQKGIKMAEPSTMTFVLKHEGNGWKIASWTYAAASAAAPDK
jgi:hypothetical protein